MPKSILDRILNWPYHPQMTLAVAFASCIVMTMQEANKVHADAPGWAVLIAAAIEMPFVGLLLCIPYFVSVLFLAVLFSLLQAILSTLRHPNTRAR